MEAVEPAGGILLLGSPPHRRCRDVRDVRLRQQHAEAAVEAPELRAADQAAVVEK